ncbi:MAG: MFS transporter [Chloroflexota bacterium]
MTLAPAARRRRLVAPDAPTYRWWLLAVTSLGALLASLTGGTLVIALPDILRDLHTDLFALLWIVVGYTLVSTVLVLNAGKLADRWGRVRAFTGGVALFTLASVWCAIAPDPTLLILGRVIQGVGGAFMLATSSALVTDAFPRSELGKALGINAMVVGAGLILGPILGGFLTTFGWRTVFWVNLPVGLAAIGLALLVLVEQMPPQRKVSIDWVGSALYLVALLSLMTALAFGGVYGWDTWWIIGGVILFVVVMPILAWVEVRVSSPLFDLELLRDRRFLMGNLTGLLNGVARNGVLFLLVFYLQGVQGVDPVLAGVMLAPLALGLLVLSPISGMLADRHGPRGLATLGMVVTGIGLAGLMTIGTDTPYWQLALWQLVIGAGSGLFQSPNTSAVMGVVPPQKRGVGAGIRGMLTSTGFVISIALAIGLMTTAMDPDVMVSIFAGTQVGSQGIDLDPFIQALHIAFGAGVIASFVGAAVSWGRGAEPGEPSRAPAMEVGAESVVEDVEAGAAI